MNLGIKDERRYNFEIEIDKFLNVTKEYFEMKS